MKLRGQKTVYVGRLPCCSFMKKIHFWLNVPQIFRTRTAEGWASEGARHAGLNFLILPSKRQKHKHEARKASVPGFTTLTHLSADLLPSTRLNRHTSSRLIGCQHRPISTWEVLMEGRLQKGQEDGASASTEEIILGSGMKQCSGRRSGTAHLRQIHKRHRLNHGRYHSHRRHKDQYLMNSFRITNASRTWSNLCWSMDIRSGRAPQRTSAELTWNPVTYSPHILSLTWTQAFHPFHFADFRGKRCSASSWRDLHTSCQTRSCFCKPFKGWFAWIQVRFFF